MPINLTPEQSKRFHELRRDWLAIIKPLDGFVPSGVIEPVPLFHQSHLDGTQVLPQRENVIANLPKNRVVAEIGTQEGVFAKKLWDGLSPQELHLFDIDFAPFHKRKAFPSHCRNLSLHQGDSSTLLSQFPDAYFDIIYIDGDHSYEGAKRDAEVAVKKIKPEGFLWFNDFTIWSPVEMIDYGVPYVVSDLCHAGRWSIKYLTLHPLFYNDVVLVKQPDQLKY